MSGKRSPWSVKLKDILRKLRLNFTETVLEAKEALKSLYILKFNLLTPQRTLTKALSERGMLPEHVFSMDTYLGSEERKTLLRGHLTNATFPGTSLPTCSPRRYDARKGWHKDQGGTQDNTQIAQLKVMATAFLKPHLAEAFADGTVLSHKRNDCSYSVPFKG